MEKFKKVNNPYDVNICPKCGQIGKYLEGRIITKHWQCLNRNCSIIWIIWIIWTTSPREVYQIWEV